MRNPVITIVCCLIMFSNTVRAQEVTIGKDNFWIDMLSPTQNYSYFQTIYKQEWVHASGQINKIAFYKQYSEGPSVEVSIYMGHTSKDAFEEGIFKEDWVPFSDLTLVYKGTLTFPTAEGWFEINLQTPFNYNNEDNLAIAIDRNSTDNRNQGFRGSLINNDQSKIGADGPDNIDPAKPVIPTTSPSMLSPNIKLSGNLTISPYLYVYMPEKSASTTPGRQVSFDIETNQADFEVSCNQSWLSFTKDIVNKKITGTVLGSTGDLSDWKQTATIVVSSSGTASDTCYLNRFRFEPAKMVMDGQYFADYDNDVDLDIVGNSMNVIRNDGNDIFSPVYNPEFPINNDASYRADYDNDGDLDFLYKSDSLKIYRNDNNGKFTKIQVIADLKIERDENLTTPWCDYDNDGDLDLLLTGLNSLDEPKNYLYKNTGNDVFINSNVIFKAVHKGSIEWIDYNCDGYIDLMLSGSDMNGSVTTNLYKNEGNGKFTLIPADFPKLFNGRFSWGDYDADGDPDLIIGGSKEQNGHTTSTYENKIFRNDGNNKFTDIQANLQKFFGCKSNWIDFDNDGDLDIVMFGYTENYYSKAYLIYYENRGDDQFAEVFRDESMEIVQPVSISISSGNYDNDTDIDFLLKNKPQWDNYCSLFRNNYNIPNAKPLPPNKFGVLREGTETILYWNSGSDAETLSKALQYNIRVGSSPGKSDIINPHANITTGFITMPDLINCRDTIRILENLPLGTYYYSIQSIDNMLVSSEFSSEQSFEVKDPYSTMELGTLPLRYASFAVGDYDKDGDYDFLITGKIDWWASYYTKLFRNNGDSTFTDTGLSFIQAEGNADWGDFDNDNDLDLLVRGKVDSDTHKTVIYRNDGNGVFTDIGFKEIIWSNAQWADFDNDGDLDIVQGNRTFKNYGNDSISFYKDHSQVGRQESLAVADYDKDNDMDIATIASITELYNNEAGSFIKSDNKFFNTNPKIGLAGIMDWSDLNNDDYPDLFITGQDTFYTKQTLIYRNNKDGSFAETDPDIRAVIAGSALTGDYNGDGNSDIIIAGQSSEILLTVYENEGSEKFKDVYTYLPADAGNAIIDWIDYNNDGYLDLLSNYNILFSNNSNTVKLPPVAPKNLQTEILGFDVNFSWEKPSEDSHYSFNLRVGTTPGGTEVMSPMADIVTGKRLILEKGNAQFNTGWTLKNLKAAQIYYWSVQAVDNGFKGGAWAPEKSFTMQTVYPDFVADTACNGFPTSFTDMSVSPLGNITNWKWDFGDKEISLIQNPKHIYKNPGEYTVTLAVKKDSLTFSKTAKVLVKASPKAGFTSYSIPKNRTLVTFANTSDTVNIAVTKWQWDFGDGLSFTGRDPQPHGYSANGLNKVSLIVKTENGCSDTAKADIYICNETLEKPEIISHGPNVWYLQCNIETAKHYKWYLNNKIISEATSYFYLANQKTGIYKVEISDKGECYIPSDELKIPTGITGIEDSDPFEGVKIYPNPTPGIFTIEMDNNIFGELIIDIYNQTGSKALNIKFEKTTEHFQTQIDLSGQSKGMYLINLSLDEFRAIRKVVVE